MGLFTDLFSSKPAEEAAAAKKLGYENANTAATGALDAGQTAANGYYDQAYSPFSALYETGKGVYDKFSGAYADATGVNGADGIARGGSTFKSLPGYSGGLTTGIDAVDRGAAARGQLGGGNTNADVIKFASDYDANKYGNYLSSLVPGMQSGQSLLTAGATGEAGVKTAQAGTTASIANQKANYGYNSATGVGNANADAALAPYSASQNFWGALMGGANLLGKATGIGGWGSSGSGSSGGTASTINYGGQAWPSFV